MIPVPDNWILTMRRRYLQGTTKHMRTCSLGKSDTPRRVYSVLRVNCHFLI